MKSTLQHDWQKAHDQGQLDHIPSTLMMSGNLEGGFFFIKISILLLFQIQSIKQNKTFCPFLNNIFKRLEKATAGSLLAAIM